MKKFPASKAKISGPRGKAPQSISRGEGTTHRSDLYQSIAEVIRAARTNAYRAVNFTMVEAYWNVERMIVEDEQRGKERAKYGAALLRNLSVRLTQEFGKGFTETNLKYFRQFYLAFPAQSASGIGHTLCDQLTWSHYRLLMRVEKPSARAWYQREAIDQNWTVSALERQINSLYYERLLLSRDHAPVIEEMQAKTAALTPTPKDFIAASASVRWTKPVSHVRSAGTASRR